MRWPIYLVVDVLSIPLIASSVIGTDYFESIGSIIPDSPDFVPTDLDGLFTKSSLDILTGVTFSNDNDATSPSSDCLFGKLESTNQIQRRHDSSSDSTCSKNPQNGDGESGIKSPILV